MLVAVTLLVEEIDIRLGQERRAVVSSHTNARLTTDDGEIELVLEEKGVPSTFQISFAHVSYQPVSSGRPHRELLSLHFQQLTGTWALAM